MQPSRTRVPTMTASASTDDKNARPRLVLHFYVLTLYRAKALSQAGEIGKAGGVPEDGPDLESSGPEGLHVAPGRGPPHRVQSSDAAGARPRIQGPAGLQDQQ